MTKIQMPEPVAFRWRVPIVDSDGRQCGESDWKFGTEKGGHPWWTRDNLITITQAEAYKDACVREALLEAYRSMQELHMSLMNDAIPYVPPAQIASFAANRISALIPKEQP